MYKKKNQRFYILLAAAAVMLISSCKKDKDPEPEITEEKHQYLLTLALPGEVYPVHTLKSLDGGSVDADQSQEIPGIDWSIPVAGRDGFVIMNSTDKLTKYTIGEDGILKAAGSTANMGVSSGPLSTFLDSDRLFVTTSGKPTTNGVFNYQVINVKTMTQEKAGTITVPTAANSTASIQGYIAKEGKLYVSYIHANAESGAAYDSATVAVFNAATFAYEKLISSKSTSSLSYAVVRSHGFDEAGNLYITSCNSNYWGANESKPSGILRIKAGQSDFDKDYFFNLSSAFGGNHTGGMVYVANNKAIVQVFRTDLVGGVYANYNKAHVLEYYLVDLVTKATQKLDIPLCRAPRHALHKLKNGKAVIVGNTAAGNFLYVYDPVTNKVTKGLTYEGAEVIETFISLE